MMKHDYDLKELRVIKVKGFKYNIMPRYENHYVSNNYEEFSLNLLKRLLGPGQTFVDVGAHYGIYSLVAGSITGSKVYSYEPVPENYQILKKNLAINNIEHMAENIAISDEQGTAQFNIPWASDSAGFYDHPLAESIRKIEVQMDTLDNRLKNISPDLIKIDTEGHEVHVLNGLTRTLAKNKKLKMIIELNPDCLLRAGTSASELISLIQVLGKDVYLINEEQACLYKIQNPAEWIKILPKSGYANILCVPRGSTYVCAFSHSMDLGGAELALTDLATQVFSDNILFHVVVPKQGGQLRSLLKDRGVSSEVISSRNWTKSSGAQELLMWSSGAETIGQTYWANKEKNFDVFLSNTITTPWALVAGRLLGKPTISFIHEYGEKDHGLSFSYPYTEILKHINDLSDQVIFNSQTLAKFMIKGGIDKEKAHVYYLQYNQPEWLKEPAIRQAESEKTILTVGRIYRSKGQLDTVKAVSILLKKGYKLRLKLIGDLKGDEKYVKEIKAYIKDNKLQKSVELLGYIHQPVEEIDEADIIVTSSTIEAFGRTTVEGMLRGKLVIAANTGASPEIIEDGKTGLLYAANDSNDLAVKIKFALDNPKKLQSIALEALNIARMKYSNPAASHEISGKIKKISMLQHSKMNIDDLKKILDLMYGEFAELMTARAKKEEEITQTLNSQVRRISELEQQIRELNQAVLLRQRQIDLIVQSKRWRYISSIDKVRRIMRKKHD